MSSPRSSVWLPFGPVFSPLSSDATAALISPALRFVESRFARTDGSIRLPLSGVAPPRYHMLGINVSFGRLSSKIKHRRGFGSAGRPIEQFDDVDDGHADALADLHRAADIAGRDDVRVEPREIGGLAVADRKGTRLNSSH